MSSRISPFVWLDTEDTSGEVFLLRAADFGAAKPAGKAQAIEAGMRNPAHRTRAPDARHSWRRGSPLRDRLDWSSIRPPIRRGETCKPKERPRLLLATRLVAAIRIFARSEVGWKAKLMFAAIVALLLGANGLNVANSYVNRNLMSAIAERHIAAFVQQAQLTLAVFAGSTIVAVLARFAEERLGLLWREFVTERCVAAYMANGTYYRLAMSGELANPDQRIAEDMRAFTATTLSFALMAMNSAFTILAFSGVLWSISPDCFRHLRRLCRARLVSDDQAWPAAR